MSYEVPGNDPWKSRAGRSLWANSVKLLLEEQCPALSFDKQTRAGEWYPYQDEKQGVWYWQKHLCTMDRGEIPEDPIWEFDSELVEVPLQYAMRQDMPILSLSKETDDETMDGTNDAHVLKQTPQRVCKSGWKHLFASIIDEEIPELPKSWFARTFGVSMEWYRPGMNIMSLSFQSYMRSLQEDGHGSPIIESSFSSKHPCL